MNTIPLALPAPQIKPFQQIENASTSYVNNKIVPYEPNIQQDTFNDPSSKDNFDLMVLIADVQNVPDEDLVMTGTEVEEEMRIKTNIKKSTKTLFKKNPLPVKLKPHIHQMQVWKHWYIEYPYSQKLTFFHCFSLQPQ